MTAEKLKELMISIDNYFGKQLTTDERRARAEIYYAALKDIPDDVAARALVEALKVCRFQNQLLVDWCAEIRKVQALQLPSPNVLWEQAAEAARKIEANIYYMKHGGLMTNKGKIVGESFKTLNAEIFDALPAPVKRWAGSPADLCDIFSSRSNAELIQFVRPGFIKAISDATDSPWATELIEGSKAAQIGDGTK